MTALLSSLLRMTIVVAMTVGFGSAPYAQMPPEALGRHAGVTLIAPSPFKHPVSGADVVRFRTGSSPKRTLRRSRNPRSYADLISKVRATQLLPPDVAFTLVGASMLLEAEHQFAAARGLHLTLLNRFIEGDVSSALLLLQQAGALALAHLHAIRSSLPQLGAILPLVLGNLMARCLMGDLLQWPESKFCRLVNPFFDLAFASFSWSVPGAVRRAA